MGLHFDVALCVRATSKFSECTKCIDACPESLELVDNLPAFAKATGIEAASCVGVCPTEAFSLSDFSTTEFFFTFLESKVRLISPKFNIPCISVLSVEHLISFALASEEEITLDLSSYDENSILFEQIEARIEEANFVLSSFSKKQLVTNHIAQIESQELNENDDEVTSRRSFLGNASLKGVVKHKKFLTFPQEQDLKNLMMLLMQKNL